MVFRHVDNVSQVDNVRTSLPCIYHPIPLPRYMVFPMKYDHVFLPKLLHQICKIYSKYFSDRCQIRKLVMSGENDLQYSKKLSKK